MSHVFNSLKPLVLQHTDAVQLNEDLLLRFQKAFEKNPAVDLLSVVPTSYRLQHRKVQYRELTPTGRLNLRTVNELYDRLVQYPEIHLLESAFPSDYARNFEWMTAPKDHKPIREPQTPPDFRKKFDNIRTATVISPLSDKACALLKRYSDVDNHDPESLATSLKRLIWDSEKLWELNIRGIVVKCDDSIVIKVNVRHSDYCNEYTNLQYLEEHTPDIPVPRPHGMVIFGSFRAIFMSYIPGVTVAKIWPSLSHEEKLQIQRQLDQFFCRLRTLKQHDGVALGGVNGEGAKDYRVNETKAFKNITTTKEFEELQFSANHRASPFYVRLLRSFLQENEVAPESVFTHGDLKKSNIMVKRGASTENSYTITGVIDWEDSGFYPEYYESTTLTEGQSILEDDDWYLYAPSIISPSRFPVRWLVDRLWGNLLWSWKSDIVR
ncbi:hypothetical protein AJ78_06498 [Emergomyces pasteurianus Ep9510]|uniref:Aminoglycoside phosphotransferase domain-containing protein n=1 Tax=Emergomyces pasteurianus Ep9510 TaxID=1447872 RepID=A0A1J9Q9Y1_9EURO|nr:hypothetical protein AJ78_06498 [Emergomyces pasteurianus Ep9510]